MAVDSGTFLFFEIAGICLYLENSSFTTCNGYAMRVIGDSEQVKDLNLHYGECLRYHLAKEKACAVYFQRNGESALASTFYLLLWKI